jgi:hypothetical protein
MLDKFKALIGEKPRARSEWRSYNPNFVTDPARIASFFNDLAYQKSVLFLSLADNAIDENPEDMLTSYLYKVGTERAAMQRVDDPEDDAKLRRADTFKVITDIFDNVLTFRTGILDVQSEGDQEYYIIAIPKRVYYPKNCKPRRTMISKHRKVPVYLRFQDPPKTIPGIIDDLSSQGAGILLSSENIILPYIRKLITYQFIVNFCP